MNLSTVFSLISAGPQISAPLLGAHIEISVSSLISAVYLHFFIIFCLLTLKIYVKFLFWNEKCKGFDI